MLNQKVHKTAAVVAAAVQAMDAANPKENLNEIQN